MTTTAATTLRLRSWQHAALQQFRASGARDFLAVATPGAGKTRFALAAVLTELAGRPGRVVIVAPTRHLKDQWAQAAQALGLHLSPDWNAAGGRPPADVHGVVVTYQQIAAGPAAVAGLSRDAVVVLDEIHHAGDDRAWGDALRLAFRDAARRLALSGTPFRSDTAAIPFVRYDDGQAVPDVEYGYADALADGGVVRPVHFPRLGGRMEWTAPDGSHRTHTFADRLDRTATGQRLRTALSLAGDWLPTVLGQADAQLTTIRRSHPDAAGLVLATDVDHARGIAGLLRRVTGTTAEVVTNDDARSSERIGAFASGRGRWLVAVRMVSEGVDIPRLRVGVYATTTATELFFRQAVGRLVRWTPGAGQQPAFLHIPDDPRLREFAANMAEHRRHQLRRDDDDEEEALDVDPPLVGDVDEDEQLSLFAAISAVPEDSAAAVAEPSLLPEVEAARPESPGEVVEIAPPPPLPGASGAVTVGRDLQRERQRLRAGNRDRARAIATLAGLPHRKVNAELNRLAGVTSVNGATVDALQRRLRHAERWLARL